MRVYFSGGSPIPETYLRDPSPDIMLSFWVDGKKGKPTARMKRLLKIRRKKKHADRKSNNRKKRRLPD